MKDAPDWARVWNRRHSEDSWPESTGRQKYACVRIINPARQGRNEGTKEAISFKWVFWTITDS
jgi:hypothetical protein